MILERWTVSQGASGFGGGVIKIRHRLRYDPQLNKLFVEWMTFTGEWWVCDHDRCLPTLRAPRCR